MMLFYFVLTNYFKKNWDRPDTEKWMKMIKLYFKPLQQHIQVFIEKRVLRVNAL